MTYTIHFRNPEYEDYTGLADEQEVREVVEQEARNTVDFMGSDILEDPGPECRDAIVKQLTDDAMRNLWVLHLDGSVPKHRFPEGTNVELWEDPSR